MNCHRPAVGLGIAAPLLAALLFLTAAHESGAQTAALPTPAPTTPALTEAQRASLEEVAGDPALAPWQRDLTREMLGGGTAAGGDAPAPASSGEPARFQAVAGAEEGSWFPLPPPAGLQGHSAIYDPVRDRILVFGGYSADGLRNDVWELTLSESPSWSLISPSGSPPQARQKHLAVYDPVRDRMIVFGGMTGSETLFDVWALSLSGNPEWSELPALFSPSPGSATEFAWTAVYDPARDQLVALESHFMGKVYTLTLHLGPSKRESVYTTLV